MSALQDHVAMMHRAWPDNLLMRFYLAHGRDYAIGPATFAGPRGKPQQCYMNATLLALRDSTVTYVEGYVSCVVPLQHAWCVTADGVVIDPTLGDAKLGSTAGTTDRISDYFGVPFRTDYLMKASTRNKRYGLLDIMSAPKTMPKLIELGLEDGQRWLLDGKRRKM